MERLPFNVEDDHSCETSERVSTTRHADNNYLPSQQWLLLPNVKISQDVENVKTIVEHGGTVAASRGRA